MRQYPYWQVMLAFFALFWSAAGPATFIILKTPPVGRKRKKKWPILVIAVAFLAIWMMIDRYYAPRVYWSGMPFGKFLSTWIAHKLTFRV